MEQRSREWREARIGRVTASTVGAILGLSPSMTRDDVLRAMVRETLGAEPEFKGNVATNYGTFHENGIKDEFEIETGKKVEPCGFYTYEEWLGASPDGLVGEHGLFECKAPYSLRNEEKPEFKLIQYLPDYYAQVQIQMLCAKKLHCFFYQWAPKGTSLEVVFRFDEWIEDALPRLQRFHDEYMIALENPDEHLAPLRVNIDTPAAHKMVAEWDEINDHIDQLQERKKDLLEAMVKLGNGRNSVIAGRKLSKVEKAGAISYAKAIKELAPDADLEKWRGQPSSYWVLK